MGYGAFWKVGQASLMYILTQLAKMLFLATFFPMSELEEEEGAHKFDFFNDFLRATVDMADLVGIYFVMSRVSGKGSVKVLIAGLGWAFAELVLTRLVFLWVGARGVGSTGGTSRRASRPTSPFFTSSLLQLWFGCGPRGTPLIL